MQTFYVGSKWMKIYIYIIYCIHELQSTQYSLDERNQILGLLTEKELQAWSGNGVALFCD